MVYKVCLHGYIYTNKQMVYEVCLDGYARNKQMVYEVCLHEYTRVNKWSTKFVYMDIHD